MKYILRNYQDEAVRQGVKFLKGNEPGGAIIVMPTGSGKSLVIANIIKQLDGNTLVLQPSAEILWQNYEKMVSYVGIKSVGIFSASTGRKDIGKITFATIGSIIHKKEMFENFQHLIVDETHIANAKGGMIEELINYMGGKVLGLTATPYRLHAYTDFRTGALSVVAKFLHRTRPRLFSKIIHITQIQDLYKMGYLCPIEYQQNSAYKHSEIKLNSTGMDFDENSLFAYNEAHQIVSIATDLIAGSGCGHILVFMSSVDEADRLAQNLRSKYIPAEIISSKTKKNDRARILEEFKIGKIRVVCNFGTLTTGFDFPELDCVILGRPTQSVALYYQMMGRGIRIAPGKEKVKIYDICGNVKRFGKIETFEIVEPSPNMHRLKSDSSFLTGFCFYRNEDVEATGYKGLKETEFGGDKILKFGKYKGMHVAKVTNGYLEWGVKNLKGSWQKMFEKEFERREISRREKYNNGVLPF